MFNEDGVYRRHKPRALITRRRPNRKAPMVSSRTDMTTRPHSPMVGMIPGGVSQVASPSSQVPPSSHSPAQSASLVIRCLHRCPPFRIRGWWPAHWQEPIAWGRQALPACGRGVPLLSDPYEPSRNPLTGTTR